MLSRLAFFAFIGFDNELSRRRYNTWGVFDHTPENRRLTGVAWGDRWARASDPVLPPDEGPLAATDFVTMYWFNEPHDASIAEWGRLSRDSFQWGRGSRFDGISRALAGLFVPIRGYASPRIHMDADTLPFRPHRGVHITVLQYDEPRGAAAHEQFRWHDRVRIPDLLSCPGVAGAWTFALDREYHPGADRGAASIANAGYGPEALRVLLLFLDEEPTDVMDEVSRREAEWNDAGRGNPHPEVGHTLFEGVFRTIDPWVAREEDPDSSFG